MKAKLLILSCTAALVFLAGATPAMAGQQFSFGFGFGYPGYPAYGYFGYYSAPPAYVYPAYVPPVVYPVPVVRPYYYYAPYRYRAVPAYRPYYIRPHKGGHHGAYAQRRGYHH